MHTLWKESQNKMAPKKSGKDSRSVSRSRSRSRDRRSSKKSSRHRSSHKKQRRYSTSSSSTRSQSRDRRRSRSRSPKRHHSSRSSRHHTRSDSRERKYSKSQNASSETPWSAAPAPQHYFTPQQATQHKSPSVPAACDGFPVIPPPNVVKIEAPPEEEEEEEEEETSQLPFKNDGSFLEMFKKMSEPKPAAEDIENPSKPSGAAAVVPKPGNLLSFVGKRKGGKILPTGKVEKLKKPAEDEQDNSKKDAWSQYMSEVRKYKERNCQEERQNRPLVK